MRVDITGVRYGKLVAVSRVGTMGHDTGWLCACDCGGEKVVLLGSLKAGRTKSCGCIPNTIGDRVRTHGLTGTRTYNAWQNLRDRCNNPNNIGYSGYGGRGIKVCQEWDSSFEAFLRDMGVCPPKLTIDRIDNNKGYEPGNCRWVTMKENNNNRRVRIDAVRFEGKSINEWAEILGEKTDTIKHRLAKTGAVFKR